MITENINYRSWSLFFKKKKTPRKKCLPKYIKCYDFLIGSWINHTTQKGFEMCDQGQCHRVQSSNPAWAWGAELCEKGLQETFLRQGCLHGLKWHFSSSPHHWSLPKLLCPCLPTSFADPDPQLGLGVLHPRGCSHSPQPSSAGHRWGGGTGPWGEVPALTCPTTPLPPALAALHPEPFSWLLLIGTASMKRHSQQLYKKSLQFILFPFFTVKIILSQRAREKNIFVTVSLITGVAAVLWLHGMFKACFCKYLHVCTSYKRSNCMDVRIPPCVYMPIFAGSGPCSTENILPKWSQANSMQIF